MGKHIDFDLLMETAKQYGDDYVNFVLTVELIQEFEDIKNYENLSTDVIIKRFKKYPHIGHYVKPYEKGGFGVNRQGDVFKIEKVYDGINEKIGDITVRETKSKHYLIKFIDSHEYQTLITEKQLSSIYNGMLSYCDAFDLKYFNQLSKHMGDAQLSGFCASDNPYHPLTNNGHYLGYNNINGIPKKSGYNRKHFKVFINQTEILDFSDYLMSLHSEETIHTTWQGKHVLKKGDE